MIGGDDNKEKNIYYDISNNSTIDHIYQSGTYTIKIKGKCETLYFYRIKNMPDVLKKIISYGKNNIKIFNVKGCTKLISIPNEKKHFSDMSNMSEIFYDCQLLTSIPYVFDTSNVTNMYNMFYNCRSLTTIPQLDTSNVIDFIRTWENCINLKCLTNLNTSSITNSQSNTFENCNNLIAPDQTTRNKLMTVNDTVNWINPNICI